MKIQWMDTRILRAYCVPTRRWLLYVCHRYSSHDWLTIASPLSFTDQRHQVFSKVCDFHLVTGDSPGFDPKSHPAEYKNFQLWVVGGWTLPSWNILNFTRQSFPVFHLEGKITILSRTGDAQFRKQCYNWGIKSFTIFCQCLSRTP